jgi:ribosomal protein S18 acetylase RimI-like enzyme
LLVRAAGHEHDDWIRELGTRAYAALGDYAPALTVWLAQPGIQRLLAFGDEPEVPLGFVLVGFAPADDLPADELIADLVAIAVEPLARQQGLGRRLIACACDLAAAAATQLPCYRIRLTVAEDNAIARRLFAGAGFVVQDPEHGHYDHGQRALRLERGLDPI